MTKSPTYQLADDRIDGGLEKFVREQREAGMSWRRIVLDLHGRTGIDMTHETLRAWFIDQPWARSASPGSPPANHRPGAPPGHRGRPRRRPLDRLDQRGE